LRSRALVAAQLGWPRAERETLSSNDVLAGTTAQRESVQTRLVEEERRAANRAGRELLPAGALAVSTQCGFASGLVGDEENLRFQHAKLARVAEAGHGLWS
jgi:hypothetical protein